MRVVVGGRGSGKTTRVLEWLRKHPSGHVVVPDYASVNRFADLIIQGAKPDRGFLVKRVLSASDPNRLRGLSGPWAADNFEQFPRHLGDTIRGDWDLITINGEGELLHAGIAVAPEPDTNRIAVSIPFPIVKRLARALLAYAHGDHPQDPGDEAAVAAFADALRVIGR